jgi:hypothetical protein
MRNRRMVEGTPDPMENQVLRVYWTKIRIVYKSSSIK